MVNPRTRRAVHRLALWSGGLSTAGAAADPPALPSSWSAAVPGGGSGVTGEARHPGAPAGGLSHIKQVVTTRRQTMLSALVRLSARFATRGPTWIPFPLRELPIRFLAKFVSLLVHANQKWK